MAECKSNWKSLLASSRYRCKNLNVKKKSGDAGGEPLQEIFIKDNEDDFCVMKELSFLPDSTEQIK